MTCPVLVGGFLETDLWLPWEPLQIWERERDEKKPLTERELQQGYAGRGILWLALAPSLFLLQSERPSHLQLLRRGLPRRARPDAGTACRGSIYIPSWFTCFLQILQLHCRQINAVICFQQGGGNPLWHFLFLNNWSCFVFPKPYWSTRLMIVFLKAPFCSLCHRGSPGNYN